MASKRYIKKALNNMIYDVVDECFVTQIFDDSKDDKANLLISEAADFQDEMLAKINQAKTKVDFKSINTSIEEAALEFIRKLNDLN